MSFEETINNQPDILVIICHKLFKSNEFRSILNLTLTNSTFFQHCQPILDYLESIPTFIRSTGELIWCDHQCLFHRGHDRPAVILNLTYKAWYRHGVRHRDGNDLPAVINGNRNEWWHNGSLDRSGDLPAITDDTCQEWWYNNQLHRENDQPAVINITGSYWYWKGQLHRVRKPAIIRLNGTVEYWIRGKQYPNSST
jgi:hypothetical protein